jgi:signal transduction histidine kinase
MRFKQRYIVPILFFTILLVLFFNLGQWFIFSKVRSFAESVFKENLLAQTNLAASGFNGETVANLQGSSFYPPDLVSVQEKIDRLKNDYDFFNVRLLDLDGEPIFGYADSDSGALIYDYDLAPFISASAGIASASNLLSASNLYLISAYAPIYNSQDSVVAVLGIDADYGFFKSLADLRKSLVLVNILSFIFILVFGAAFILINRRLISAQEALYQASALTSMGQMAATMAHEIKNPLGIIKATSERIKSRYGKDSDDRIFDFIPEEVDRLNIILAGYLDFARPVINGRDYKKTDLKKLVENLLKQSRTDFAQDKIEFDLVADDREYVVLDDGIGLRQAILNLILNARDTYKDGGLIRIMLASDDDKHVLKIIDHGGGIKKEVRKRLFEPFSTTKTKGSGLGLYVAKKIIEQNGGSLTLKNNHEGGATAEISLPVFKEQ